MFISVRVVGIANSSKFSEFPRMWKRGENSREACVTAADLDDGLKKEEDTTEARPVFYE